MNLLTLSSGGANLFSGRRNPSSTGEKSPQPIAAFLCLSFRAVLCRVISVLAGCFGHGSSMAAPVGGFRPHFSPSPASVETSGDGYSHQLEFPL